MRALTITNTRDFMNKLLNGTGFDTFLLSEAVIETYATFHIDGALHRSFYEEDVPAEIPEDAGCTPWGLLRPVALSLIRGKHTPLSFRFTLAASSDQIRTLMPDPSSVPEGLSLLLNIRFRDGKVTLLTGTSTASFTMDRTHEQIWDAWVPQFLSRMEIESSEQ